jgi:hypothetical protein
MSISPAGLDVAQQLADINETNATAIVGPASQQAVERRGDVRLTLAARVARVFAMPVRAFFRACSSAASCWLGLP